MLCDGYVTRVEPPLDLWPGGLDSAAPSEYFPQAKLGTVFGKKK